MSNLLQRNIILGISGGIAAYKSAELTRLLVKSGANVRVCMTQAAQQFITPLTLQALSGNAVHTSLLDPEAEAGMGHIELARWANDIIIAPASADVIARLAHGFANDLLTTLCLASPAKVYIAPAMNQQMWKNPATQANLQILTQRGYQQMGPASGEQACGDIGYGRMLEPQEIHSQLQTRNPQAVLAGIRVLLTAGPTREAIDPVRFISNHSSGKMGYALAQAATALGAQVTLISGPVCLDCPHGVMRYSVESAADMLQMTLAHIANQDIFIATAAVADYTPSEVSDHKIKKSATQLSLNLQRTHDILATVSAQYPALFSVGFAAETHNLLAYARHKLSSKNLTMIAANLVAEGKVFGQDSNAIELLWQGGQHSFPEMSKTALAFELMQFIAQHYHTTRNTL